MNPRIVPFAALFRSSEGLFERSLAGLTREQGLACVGSGTNPVLWIAAHLATARYGLAQMIGLDRPRPWGTRFTRGSDLGDLAALPEVEDIRGAWSAISAELGTRLEALADAELDAPCPRQLPIDDKSVLGGVAFLAYHEAYHIGQMALVRKALGLGGLVG